MKIVIVGFTQYEKKALIYREVNEKVKEVALNKAGSIFLTAINKGATIISTRVLEENESELG